jgi:hypothetical protein
MVSILKPEYRVPCSPLGIEAEQQTTLTDDGKAQPDPMYIHMPYLDTCFSNLS